MCKPDKALVALVDVVALSPPPITTTTTTTHPPPSSHNATKNGTALRRHCERKRIQKHAAEIIAQPKKGSKGSRWRQ